ncbi:hypothetical protein PAMA_001871 [Pampus argenteus]
MARLSLAEVGLLLLLALALMLCAKTDAKKLQTLRRKKREWILPPAKLYENTDYTHRNFIAKIRSDEDLHAKVEYYLTGPGTDQAPFNLFIVDHNTGFIRVTGILDREEYPFYNIKGIAKYQNGTTAEDNIPLTVTVLDQNDNAPYFELHTGAVTEASKKGTFVMQLKGKDNDQAGTINSELAYSIVSQEPEGSGHMFTIDEKTGKLFVKESTLDRETSDFYKLIIKGTDMGGAPEGLTGTGTVEIKVLDINDNIPTLEKSEYTGSVDENVCDVVVMRIKALDKDLEHTDNWLAVFTFAKGNEDNLFSIETDNRTNEGILKLTKPLDFEDLQLLELSLLIENVAPFVVAGSALMDANVQVGESDAVSTSAGVNVHVDVGIDLGVNVGLDTGVNLGVDVGPGGADAGLEGGLNIKPGLVTSHEVKPGVKPVSKPKGSYTITITVNNTPEDPVFVPDTKNVQVSEDPNEAPGDVVITVFAAVDPDTGEPADVSYAKAHDPENLLIVDEETAEIKLNKVPNRESPFLVNSIYIAKILAITKDMPYKTATGTIAIEVTDSNDHCPTLTTTHNTLCSDEKTVYVTGFDEDVSPNAAPFTFRIIPEGTRGSWDVEVINETSAALHSVEALWPGPYKLQVEVLDAQGVSCPANEVFTVDVCTCVDTRDCSLLAARLVTPSSELSISAICLLLMAMCLLLFIPLLVLLCQCGGVNTIFPDQFSDLPFDVKEHLISYHTEGKGEDKEVPLQLIPVPLGTQTEIGTAQALTFKSVPAAIPEIHQSFYNKSVAMFQETNQSLMEVDNIHMFSKESFNCAASSATFSRQMLGSVDDIALPDAFLCDYYTQKAVYVAPMKDSLLIYDIEGQDSPAGSVGCCSLLESDNDLQFLNDLGPKFKTLAEICTPPTPTPTLSLKVADTVKTAVVEQVVKPKTQCVVETKNTGIKTENVISTNISKSSASTVRTVLPTMTLPHSEVTNISHSSNISRSATLPRPAQTVILQQQPVYYATSPVLQPMHYVVQPQLQNTVLLEERAHRGSFPGLYVVSGTESPSSGFVVRELQSPPSGLVVNGLQHSSTGLVIKAPDGPKSPTNPNGPITPVSTALVLPGSLGVSQGSAHVEGWKIMRANLDGNYTLVQDKSGPHEAKRVDPGSPQGTLLTGTTLVIEAAPPQGVLGQAARGGEHGILPGRIVSKKKGVKLQ